MGDRTDAVNRIPIYIGLVEEDLARRLRISAMETSLDTAFQTGIPTIPIPSDFLQLKSIRIPNQLGLSLSVQTAEWIYENFPTGLYPQAIPQFFAQDAGNFIFGPEPDMEYEVLGTYYRKLPALSDSNPTNWFTDNAVTLLLFGSLIFGAMDLRDKGQLPDYVQLYEKTIKDLMDSDTTSQYSGSTLRGRVV